MLLGEIAIILVLIGVNGFFAMSELAVVSSRRARLQQLAEEKRSRGARAALKLVDDPSNFLSTVQVGITLIGVLNGAFAGSTVAEPLGLWLDTLPGVAPAGYNLAIGIVVVGITILSLIIGELVPKRVALANAERIAAVIARPMLILSRIAHPAVWFLGVLTDATLRLLGQRGLRQATVTEEEVKTLIAEGTRHGVFAPGEKRMIDAVLRLADRTVRSIMTPRPDIVWIDLNDERDRAIADILATGHSRFVVSRGDIDEVVGVVQAKDLLDRYLRNESFDLAATVRKALIVHDATQVARVLELFRETGQHLAVVVDEYGSVEGIVSVTDILSMIAGEFTDASDDEQSVVRREDGSILVDGMVPVDEVESLLGQRDMRGDSDFHTLAGFVLHALGRVPKVADHFVWRQYRFEVVDMDGRRVDRVLITPPAESPPEDENA